MVITTHDRFALLPKRCYYCNRLFWLEPYDIHYREVGLDTIKFYKCTRLHFKEVKMAKTIIKNTMIEPAEMTCPNCNSVFTYTFEDIERRQRPSIIFDTGFDRVMVCPVCKKDIMMDRVEVVKEE